MLKNMEWIEEFQMVYKSKCRVFHSIFPSLAITNLSVSHLQRMSTVKETAQTMPLLFQIRNLDLKENPSPITSELKCPFHLH